MLERTLRPLCVGTGPQNPLYRDRTPEPPVPGRDLEPPCTGREPQTPGWEPQNPPVSGRDPRRPWDDTRPSPGSLGTGVLGVAVPPPPTPGHTDAPLTPPPSAALDTPGVREPRAQVRPRTAPPSPDPSRTRPPSGSGGLWPERGARVGFYCLILFATTTDAL